MEIESKTILLVEDEAILALMEKRWLEKGGFRVLHVTNGEQAIETVRLKPDEINLILMDIDLGPGIDGTQAARQILQDFDIPLLFLSSHTETSVVNKTEKITSYGYVVKGSDPTVLLASIKMAFRLFDANKSLKEKAKIIQEKAEIIEKEKQKAEQYLEVAEVMLLALDLDGRIIMINRKGCQLLGYSEPELLGKKWSETCLCPEDSGRLTSYFNEIISEGLRSFEYHENYILSKTKEKRLIAFHNALVKDSQGKVIGTLSSGEDITEKRKAEDQLRQSEDKFRQLIENMGEGLGFVDKDETFTFANTSGEEVFGVEAGKLIGRNLSEFHEQAEFEKVKSESTLRQKGIKSIYESEIRLDDGTKKTILVTATPRISPEGEFLGTFGIFRDITEKKIAVQKLRQSEQRLSNIARNIPGIVYQYCVKNNGSAYFTYLSEKASELLDLKLDEQNPEEKLLRQIPEDERVEFKNSILQAVSRSDRWEYEGRFFCMDGKLKWFQGCALPTIMPDRIIYNGILIDITERKEAEILQKKYSEELKISNATKDKFFSILAHDLRGPFSGFLAMTDELLNNTDNLTKDDIKELSSVMNSTAEKIFNLLTNLLEWSRLQLGKIELNPENIFLYDLVSDIIKLYSSSIAVKSLKVQNEVSKDTLLYADMFSLTTILSNLISNSIKFTPNEGTVRIMSVKENEETEIIISDSGIGMTEEILEKVFSIGSGFTRKGTNGEQGSGLGLVLCRELVDKNNWEMQVSSNSNKGTAFSVKLSGN